MCDDQTLQSKRGESVGSLRSLAADYMLAHAGDFQPFTSDPATGDMLSDSQYAQYCNDGVRGCDGSAPPVWGGQLELRAISQALHVPIRVVQADAADVVFDGGRTDTDDRAELIVTYHRHIYSMGEHYNSTVPCDDRDAKQ